MTHGYDRRDRRDRGTHGKVGAVADLARLAHGQIGGVLRTKRCKHLEVGKKRRVSMGVSRWRTGRPNPAQAGQPSQRRRGRPFACSSTRGRPWPRTTAVRLHACPAPQIPAPSASAIAAVVDAGVRTAGHGESWHLRRDECADLREGVSRVAVGIPLRELEHFDVLSGRGEAGPGV